MFVHLWLLTGIQVSQATNPFTFHLVLSPINASANATIRPDNLYQPTGLPSLPTISNPAQTFNIPPRPASTSQMPEPGRQLAGQTQNMPFNTVQGTMQQWLPQPFGAGIQMQFPQNGRPLHPPHLPSAMNFQNNQRPPPSVSPPPWIQDAHEQMLLAQHQLLHQQMQHQMHQDLVNRGRRATPPDSGSRTPPPGQAQSHSQPRDANGPRTMPNMPNPTISTQNYPVQGFPLTFIPDPTGRASRPQSTTRQFQPNAPLGPMHPAHLHAIRQNHLQNMQLDQMSQFAQLRNAMGIPLPNVRQTITSTSTVYLLSSPRGPEALLMSPSGVFTSPGYSMITQIPSSNTERGAPTVTNTSDTRPVPSTSTPAATPTVAPTQQPEQQAPQQQPQAQPQQQQQLQQQDQAGDLLRILLPLGGQLWLVVRIIGFVYLFSGGQDWRNTIALGVIALVGFLVQTGVFNPLLRNIWRPIREHVESIINSEQARPATTNSSNQTPQQMAERLVEEHRGISNTLRRAVRRAERSALLFTASLIPGVGESQVRARERAEREQREAEERARQEAEQEQREAEERVQQTARDQREEGESGIEHIQKDEPVTPVRDTAQTSTEPAGDQAIDVD